MNKQILPLLLLLLLVVACTPEVAPTPRPVDNDDNGDRPRTADVEPTEIVPTQVVAPTSAAAPTATAEPVPTATVTAAPTATPEEAGLTGPDINFANIQLTLSKSVANRLYPIEEENGQQVMLLADENGRCGEVACFHFFHLSDADWQEESITDLAQAIIDQDPNFRFEFGSATLLLQSRTQYIVTDHIAGVAALTLHAQYPAVANNKDLRFQFWGFTLDGGTAVSLNIPITHPGLAPDGNPTQASGPNLAIPLPTVNSSDDEAVLAAVRAYDAEVAAFLDTVADAQFLPSLTDIEAILDSVQVGKVTHFGNANAAIQGRWLFSEAVDENLSASYSYFFDDGWLWFEGYPPRAWSGRYEIIDETPEQIVLQLTSLHEEGEELDDRLMTITVNADGTLTIDGQGPFAQP